MHMKKKAVLLWMLILLPVIVASGSVWAGTDISIKDMAGREVAVPFNPGRIICLAPGTLRLIVYLQAQDKVVGVEDLEKNTPETRPYLMANIELIKLPSIGPGGPNYINKLPDLEKALAVRPQVIFITYMDRDKADELQKRLGIPVVVLTYGPFATFNEVVYDSLRLAGKILNRAERAEKVVGFIEAARKDLSARTAGFPQNKKPTVYVGGIGFRGTQGIDSTSIIYPPFDWIGARNAVTSGGEGGHVFVDKEKLLGLNPEIIFIDGGGLQNVREDMAKKPEFYRGLKAFQNNRVYALHSFNWYVTNIGTVIADAYTVGKLLYPGKFTDIDPEGKADEVYSFLVGQPVYQDMIKIYGHLGQVFKP